MPVELMHPREKPVVIFSRVLRLVFRHFRHGEWLAPWRFFCRFFDLPPKKICPQCEAQPTQRGHKQWLKHHLFTAYLSTFHQCLQNRLSKILCRSFAAGRYARGAGQSLVSFSLAISERNDGTIRYSTVSFLGQSGSRMSWVGEFVSSPSSCFQRVRQLSLRSMTRCAARAARIFGEEACTTIPCCRITAAANPW
jgi:hypothetical protein